MAVFESITESVKNVIKEAKISAAICEFPFEKKLKYNVPVICVGIKGGSGVPAGVGEYLGTKYDAQKDKYIELYGKKLDIKIGFDIFSPDNESYGARSCTKIWGELAGAWSNMPEGIKVRKISCGTTEYDKSADMYLCEAEMECTAFLYAAADDDTGEFLDFKLKGEIV